MDTQGPKKSLDSAMPPKPSAYIETTIVSYLTALPSRDLVLSAHQQVTHEWWSARSAFELFVSQFVLDEAAAGDSEAAERRLQAVEGIVLLDVTEEAISLAGQLVAGGGLPQNARIDALHVAVAAANGMNYLLTWNCKHIANGSTRGRIEELCRAAGFDPPIICTPLELMQE